MIDVAKSAARAAGELVMGLYRREIETREKADRSPVTAADLAASRVIATHLASTGLPVLCEEAVIDYAIRKEWTKYWLVDPLDGTKEFLSGTDCFTVNIALIESNRPILGVVFAPALATMAWAVEKQGAFLETPSGVERLTPKKPNQRVCLTSRSENQDKLSQFFDDNGIQEAQAIGSALKFIRIAQGHAALYPRFCQSKEWDTAAGQIILLESGGWILEPQTLRPLSYNKEDLSNSHFIVGCGDWDPQSLKWPEEK